MGRRGELQVPWCLAGAVVVLRRRGRSPVVLCAGELGRGTEAEAAGARPRVQPAARRCHAGQLGQQRVPRAPAPHAGALAADHSDQPYHLFYEGFRPPRGSASDPRERYEPQPGLAPRGPPPLPGPPHPSLSLDPHCTPGLTSWDDPATHTPRALTAVWPLPPSTDPWSPA